MTKEEAIKLANGKWWEGKSQDEIAWFCISVDKLCCPFDIMHKAVEEWLGRPVWTHEFAETENLILERLKLRIPEHPVVSLARLVKGKPVIPIITD